MHHKDEHYQENLNALISVFLFDSTKKSLNMLYQSIKNNDEFQDERKTLELLNGCSSLLNEESSFIDESQNNISENKKGSIFFGGIMQINNIFLNEGKDNNMYLSLPSREIEKDGEKKYEDIIAPLSKELREAMTLACLESYKKNIIKSAEATEENTQSQENQEER